MLNGCGKPWRGEWSKQMIERSTENFQNELERGKLQTSPWDSNARPLAQKEVAPAVAKAAPFVPLAHADSKQRKMMPVISGVIDYFPDAIAAVAYVSYLGNQKHNPGQDLHWARGKSDDHIDCLGRHLLSRDGVDQDGIMEFAEMVWRGMAALQLHIEKKFNLPPSRGAG